MSPVGYVRRTWEDPERLSWSGMRPRPLRTDIWYPAVSDAVEEEMLVGSSRRPLYVSGRAARDAAPAGGPRSLPLVLLSHGTGGAALQLGWLATSLAARGYVVVGVNHHGNTLGEPYAPQGFCLWWERAVDMHVALDLLLADEALGARVDPARVGATGFSLGAHTVLALAGARTDLDRYRARRARGDAGPADGEPPELADMVARFARIRRVDARVQTSLRRHDRSYRDPRVRAVHLMAPVLVEAFTPESLGAITRPVGIVAGAADTIAPPQANAERFAERIPGAVLHVLPGEVGHYTFMSRCTRAGREAVPHYCVDHPSVDRAAVHAEVSRHAAHFFDAHLAALP